MTPSASSKHCRAGEVSPRELVEAAIARTEAVNPELNGLAFEAYDRARARARRATTVMAATSTGCRRSSRTTSPSRACRRCRARMHGIRGRCRPTASSRASSSSTGLIPLGKTQMSEFGFSGSAEHPRIGPVRNPWNPEYTAGASSSGSAAFVAAGVVPIAHANDGGGSIRIPAACNGLVGLKPTRGRLPLDKETARMPLHLVANGVVIALGARHRGVPAGGRAGVPQPQAPRDRRRHAAGHAAAAHRGLHQIHSARSQPGDPRADAEDGGTAGGTRTQGHRDRQSGARPFQGRLPRLLVVPGVGGRARRAPHVRPELRPHPTGQHDARAGPQCRPQPAQGSAGDSRAVGVAPDHAAAVRHLRRRADADAGRGHAAHRPSRPDGRLRPGDGPTARMGGVHPAAERHRRSCDLVAARRIRVRACRSA